MRITGGEYRGRRLETPRTRIRPTQDRVREALFSSLAERMRGCRFLDLYAGCGSVGLEAVSRGAAHVCAVELDGTAVASIRRNVRALLGDAGSKQVGAFVVMKRDVRRLLAGDALHGCFDLVYADPPYARDGDDGISTELLDLMRESDVLCEGGIFVIEQSARSRPVNVDGWRLLKDSVYGETRLCFYQIRRMQ